MEIWSMLAVSRLNSAADLCGEYSAKAEKHDGPSYPLHSEVN
jgi:hypothetical protein